MSEVINLPEGLANEIERVAAIRQLYLQIPAGLIAAALMQNSLNQAKAAMGTGDVMAMLSAYKDLMDYEE